MPASPNTSFLGKLPISRVEPFSGAEDTLRLMAAKALGDRGERSMLVRAFTSWVIRDIWPKDYLGEILAIRNVFVQNSPVRRHVPLFRYTNDARHVEVVKDPERMVEEIIDQGTTAVDCDEIALMCATMMLQVGREPEYVALGFARGDLSHVALRVREPKSNQWIWCDAVAGPKERDAAERAVEVKFWSLD